MLEFHRWVVPALDAATIIGPPDEVIPSAVIGDVNAPSETEGFHWIGTLAGQLLPEQVGLVSCAAIDGLYPPDSNQSLLLPVEVVETFSIPKELAPEGSDAIFTSEVADLEASSAGGGNNDGLTL